MISEAKRWLVKIFLFMLEDGRHVSCRVECFGKRDRSEWMNGILALFFSVQMCLNLKLQILQMSALVTLGLVHAVDSFLITDSIYHGWRTAPRGALGLSLAISSVLAWAWGHFLSKILFPFFYSIFVVCLKVFCFNGRRTLFRYVSTLRWISTRGELLASSLVFVVLLRCGVRCSSWLRWLWRLLVASLPRRRKFCRFLLFDLLDGGLQSTRRKASVL